MSSLRGKLLRAPILQFALGLRKFDGIIFESHSRHGQRSGAFDFRKFFLQPGQTQRAAGFFRRIVLRCGSFRAAKRKQRPARRQHQGIAIHAVHAWIATIPTTARAHAVVNWALLLPARRATPSVRTQLARPSWRFWESSPTRGTNHSANGCAISGADSAQIASTGCCRAGNRRTAISVQRPHSSQTGRPPQEPSKSAT